MGMIKLLFAPIRGLARFPLFQLAIAIAAILFLQAADEKSVLGELFDGLDKLVSSSVTFISSIITVKSFTKAWLTSGFMIAYVYLAGLLILFLLGVAFRIVVDLIGRNNLFWLRNAIARERGIAAYRAWLPFERIRPTHCSQREWERGVCMAPQQPAALPIAHAARVSRNGVLWRSCFCLPPFCCRSLPASRY